MKLAASLAFASLYAMSIAADIPNCGDGLPACPEEYPCCSVDGTCGNGYVCLGGCDPKFSFATDSCMPLPVCQSGKTTFTSTDQITPYADYMGDAEKMPWSYLGNITTENGVLRAQMFPNTGGTAISSSNLVWYGKVSITFKTSYSAGVVSDMILLSSVKDEIDYEFVGSDMTTAQTNYYWQGALVYTKGEKSPVSSNTMDNFHTYTVDWQEDQINWIIDGQTVRTLNKQDTYNATSNTYAYPQTPARVQFGLWPGGASNQPEGTRQWAGGDINWNMGDPGYYYVDVESIEIDCYDPPAGTTQTGNKAYVYTNRAGLQSDVEITNNSTILLSTDGTGTNPLGSKANSNSGNDTSSDTSGGVLSGILTSSHSSSSVAPSSSAANSSTAASSSMQSSSASNSSSVVSSTEAKSSSSAAASSADETSTSVSSAAPKTTGPKTATPTLTAAESTSSQASASSKAANAAQAVGPLAALFAVVPAALLL